VLPDLVGNMLAGRNKALNGDTAVTVIIGYGTLQVV
jgi:hypothetical protein